MVSRRSSLAAGLLGSLAALVVPSLAQAAPATPTLRYQADIRGNVAVFGSTLGYDCGTTATPPAGATISCAGQTNVDDTAPDIFWRDNVANASIQPLQARTSATLKMPDGAKVTYARLYWAAIKNGAEADTTATLDWDGGPSTVIKADQTWTRATTLSSFPNSYYYQASGDATEFISDWGAGDFRVTDVDAMPLAGLNLDRAFSAWTMVVFYEDTSSNESQQRNLALFDAFSYVAPADGTPSVTAQLSGFLVPPGFIGRMSAFAYEGDNKYTGDSFSINGVKASNAFNPASDFFNSSRSDLGKAVSGDFDVPKLSGEMGSMAGYDLDTVDISTVVKPGDTKATIGAASDYDIFLLGGFVTSLTNLAPDFAVKKTATDVNGGALQAGDVVEYVITAKNQGSDTSINTSISDVLEDGIDYVPGSLKINGASVTDAKDGDSGSYNSANRTITWYIGSGASGTKGGSVAVGATYTVSFRVKVAENTESGSVSNQAYVTAVGEKILASNPNAPSKQWLSDGDPTKVGSQPTVITVNECQTDKDCADPLKPHCNTTTFVCEGCKSDSDCSNPLLPACQPDGSCNECREKNDAFCKQNGELCNVPTGTCATCIPTTSSNPGDATKCANNNDGHACVVNPGTGVNECGCTTDTDCGLPNSGRVCDTAKTLKCIDGCRGQGGNGCPTSLSCTSSDSSIGSCVQVPENTDALCSDNKDNDGDGKVDCDDSDCKTNGVTACLENTDAKCKDGKDNDGDGTVDCDDTDCQDNAAVTVCPSKENTDAKCKDGKDNDGDGKTDCDDEDCKVEGVSVCADNSENTDAECADGKDNDEDSLIDCADPSCAGTKPCPTENTVEKCKDGLDNDNNGKKDCADPACKALPEKICGSENTDVTCKDGFDNDGNGKTDCDDPSCSQNPSVTVCKSSEDSNDKCKDGLDNDGDGKTDCEDDECNADGVVVCGESSNPKCSDGKDNDGDGLTDCDDDDCKVATVTVCGDGTDGKEENTNTACQDKKDNDGDGKVDCADSDCKNTAVCGDGTNGKGEGTDALCSDGKDNDGDDKVDCSDPDCLVEGISVCAPPQDSDQDGGCGCTVPGNERTDNSAALVVGLLGLATLAGRRRSARRG